MPGSILVGLDGSEYCHKAMELAIRWAKPSQATVAGLAVLDEPAICHGELVPLGGSAFKEHRDQMRMEDARKRIDGFLTEFEENCESAGIEHRTLRRIGHPEKEIILAAQEFDVILLGLQTFFHFETHDAPGDTVNNVIRQAPRPVVAVPRELPEGNRVVIAYDGSLQAARALQIFQGVGLDDIHDVHIVSVNSDEATAQEHAKRAAGFLAHHMIDSTVHAVASTSSTAQVLLEQAAALGAGLLVMGAYGKSSLVEFFFGSVTKNVLRQAAFPIFLYH